MIFIRDENVTNESRKQRVNYFESGRCEKKMQIKWKFMLALLPVMLAIGCSSEPKQSQPVITKTDAGTSTAPPAREAEKRDNALVRVINAGSGTQTFDVFADDKKLFDDVSFKSVTPYTEISDIRHAFRVREAGHETSQPLAEKSESLSGGKHYTIVVMPGTNDKTSLYVFNDNLTPPPPEKAEVRVIHASPDAGEVDVVAKQGNKKLFTGVNFEKETSYADVDPMTSTIEVRPEGQDKALASVANTKFEKGKIYTIIVAGRAKGAPKLQAVMIEDRLGAGATAANEEKTPKVPESPRLVKTKSSKY